MKNTVYPDNFTKKRAERQRRARKRRIITFLISIIILLCVTAVTLCFTVFFPIESISVSGSKIYTSSEILDASYVKNGDNIFAFSSENLEREIRKKLPFIESISVKRSLNGTLALKITDAKEKYCYESVDGFFTVGKDGFVLKSYDEQPQGILLIKGMEADLSIGEYVEYGSDKKTEILNKLLEYEQSIPIDTIDITDEYSISIGVDNRFEVYLGTSNSIKEKMAHLGSMTQKIGEDKSGKINLSYWSADKPEGTFVEKSEE